jgi:hypothetical protein
VGKFDVAGCRTAPVDASMEFTIFLEFRTGRKCLIS